ncbi:hypothetical protein BZA70DRAFT_117393 [Myxozyma melibiosi]|uniref:Uncharacterized protein n=1 Tax=Myxozyma melibiosi TaxID=54550 RepID=A0ABR1FAL4_9ASCO
MMPNLESLRLGKMTMDRGDKAGVEAALKVYMGANHQYKSVTLDDCPNLPERLPIVGAKFWQAFDEIKILRTFAFNTSLLPTGPGFQLTSLPRLRKLVLSGSLYTFNRWFTSLGTYSTPDIFFQCLRELTHCLAPHLLGYGNGLVPEAPDSDPVQVPEVEILYLVEKKPPKLLLRQSFHSPGEVEPMVTTNASKTGYLFIDESLALAKDIAVKY